MYQGKFMIVLIINKLSLRNISVSLVQDRDEEQGVGGNGFSGGATVV